MAEANLVNDRRPGWKSTHTIRIACLQVIGVIGIWPLVIGHADIHELLRDT
jgi:hypothetical protein